MQSERRQRIEELFEEALGHDASTRSDFVAEACSGDAELRLEVEALLGAHARASGLLEQPAADAAVELVDRPPERIGPYRLRRRLGRGGMGDVFLAERDDGQFQQRVAIKLLRTGFDDIDAYRRFLAERQILASLDHRNVARLLDGGVTNDGSPFLAMEYVEGLPVTEYADRHRLDVDGRLRLFLQVCEAVAFAHRNLVVHRDLKPGNILVNESGGVKLLDFGIAKLLNPLLSPMPMPVTRTDVRAMTPEYASPEQMRGEPVTTTSDVYGLGLVLYELLTGRHPYRLGRRSPDEVHRAVLEHEPERPSARVAQTESSTNADGGTREIESASVAAARGLTVERLRRRLRGDVDAIVMMALRKEPNRRYATVDLLVQDIRRHLEGRPVAAHRGSGAYRLGKLLRRHRLPATAATLVALSLLGGAGAALWQASLARQERDRAEHARRLADQARIETERALGESQAVSDFLIHLFEATSPTETGGDSITARELLRRGAARADALTATPLVQARMLEAVGRVHLSLGDYTQAEALVQRALALREQTLGATHLDVAASLSSLGYALRRTGDYARSVAAHKRALDIRRQLLGPADSAVARTMSDLAFMVIYLGQMDEAERLFRDAVAIERQIFGDSHPQVANTLSTLAAVRRRRGDNAEAEALFRSVYDIRRSTLDAGSPELAEIMYNLGDMAWENRRDTTEAIRLYRDGLALMRGTLGVNSPRYALNVNRFGGKLLEAGKLDEAQSSYVEALVILQRVLGPRHPEVAAIRAGLAGVRAARGDLDAADQLYAESIAQLREMLGADHALLAGILTGHARLRLRRGDLTGAEAAFREALRIRTAASGAETPIVGLSLADVAYIRGRKGDFATADSLFRESLRILRREVLDQHHDVRRIRGLAAEIYDAAGDREQAAEHRSLAAIR